MLKQVQNRKPEEDEDKVVLRRSDVERLLEIIGKVEKVLSQASP
jgi:hypothetical protein